MKRDELRRRMRGARRGLSAEVRRAAAERAAELAAATSHYRDARRIAVYIAVDGELDPEPLAARARAAGKEVLLPVLGPRDDEPMHFLPYLSGAPLRPNRFRIPEPLPEAGAPRTAAELDLVLAPLVAFGARGERLGMGAGFYDRSFAFLKSTRVPRPVLLGYAYECQQVDGFESEPWDVPLAGVVTEQQFHRFPSS